LHTDRLVCNFMSDTREFIIDQAYGLFLSRSYEAVSISDISKAIGFTKGALYHHFTNKEELFMAVIDKYLPIEKFFEPIGNLTVKEYIEESVKTARKIVNSIFDGKSGFLPLSYLALFIDAYRHYPKFSKEKEILIQNEIDKIKEVLRKAIDKGEIRNDINIDYTALNFFTLGLGLASNLVISNSTPIHAIEILENQLNELYNLMKL